MRKIIALFIAVVAVTSCGLPAKQEHKIEEMGISVTIPNDKKPTVIPASQYSKASASYYIDKSRFEIREIEEASMPTDLAMLETAVKADESFKSMTDKKTLPNGAFGVVCETTKGKDFLFYVKADNRFFKVTPVFNKEGKYFQEGIEAIGTIK